MPEITDLTETRSDRPRAQPMVFGLRRMALGAAAAVVLLAWGGVGTVLYSKWNDAIQAEIRQNNNVARAFEEQTLRVLATADQATLRLRDAAAQGQPHDYVRFANETGLAPKILVQLSLADAKGRFIGSNLDPDGHRTGALDLSGREHIQAHLAPAKLPAEMRLANPDALFIGKPVLGKVSNKWTIQLSRRIVGQDGQLAGVVVASLDPSYFEDVYRKVSLGQQGGLTLVGADLAIRARVIGGQSVSLGTSFGANGPFVTKAKGSEGHFMASSTLDGVERITAYRQVTGYPLYLLVSTATDDALAGWRLMRNFTVLLTLLLSGAVAAGAAVFGMSLRRMERAHTALQVSEARANAANQAKTEFLAAISHELRTPLTSIRGFAELMENRLKEPKYREISSLIRKGAEHLNELLTQILDLAKVEAGAMQLSHAPLELRPLLQGTADFFSLAANAKGLSLSLEVAPEVPITWQGDSLRLKQILNNLLSNAMKFTEQGGITLGAKVEAGSLLFTVQDTGPGIPAALHETIFEKFRQGNDRVSYQHGGTGLGLALSRGLAELMHGTITVASREGEGACFTVRLPLPVAAASAAAAPAQAEPVVPA